MAHPEEKRDMSVLRIDKRKVILPERQNYKMSKSTCMQLTLMGEWLSDVVKNEPFSIAG